MLIFGNKIGFATNCLTKIKVLGIDIVPENVKILAQTLEGKTGKLYPIQADMAKEDQIVHAFKWAKENLGPIYILVNNAGIGKNTSIIDGDSKMWRDVLDVNLLGVAIASREAVRDMRANNVDGHIVLINSLLGHKVANLDNINMYPCSKHGITALTDVLHNELNEAKTKIKVTSISPSYVNSGMRHAKDTLSEKQAALVQSMPSLSPDDVAGAVIYALSTPPHVQVHELTIRHVNDNV